MASERSCAACRARRPKAELIRFVRPPAGGVAFDPIGSAPGRGAYTCRNSECIEQAFRRGGLARRLRASITKDQGAFLREQAVEYLVG